MYLQLLLLLWQSLSLSSSGEEVRKCPTSTFVKIGYVDTGERLNIWSPLAAIRVNERNSSRFLFHLLQSGGVQAQVKEKATHRSQPNSV